MPSSPISKESYLHEINFDVIQVSGHLFCGHHCQDLVNIAELRVQAGKGPQGTSAVGLGLCL